MMFTIKRPKSKRFFQFSFEGYKPVGRNALEKYLNSWKGFIKAFFGYILIKTAKAFTIFSKILFVLFHTPSLIKDYLVVKLIWSRGKLGRPIATIIVLGVSLIVFTFGEVFSNLRFVVAEEAHADYLANTSDIIPKKEIATTTLPDIRKRSEPFTYTVEGGDNLFAIGTKFKISVDALKYVNNLTDSSVLQVGQELTIPPILGLIHKVEKGDTLSSIALKYDVPPQSIADFNYVLDTSKLTPGTELVIPGAKIPEPVVPIYTPPVASVIGPANVGHASPSKNYCVWPSTVRIVTQYYSWYHNGVDIATPWSSGMPPLFACTGGRVVRAGWDPFGLGLHVRIDHGNGYETIYGHMSRLDVGYGQKVDRGQQLGLMGSTGNSTGPHVHFMVKFNGVAQNPLGYTN
jgi:murein DD-endopeptidase MepM/ murein hydrolase activator NlpD